jgi:hypothetical protein
MLVTNNPQAKALLSKIGSKLPRPGKKSTEGGTDNE